MSGTSDGGAGAMSADDLARRAASELPSSETVRTLETIDSAALSNDGRLSFLQATERVQGWLASLTTQPIAQLVDSALQVGEADDPESVELAVASVREELRVGLALSSPAARVRIDVAEQLAGNLFPVQDVLAEGGITYLHARTMVEAVAELDPVIARQVVDQVLPRCVDKPLSTLRRQLRRALAGLDTERIVERHESGRWLGTTPPMGWLSCWSPPRHPMFR